MPRKRPKRLLVSMIFLLLQSPANMANNENIEFFSYLVSVLRLKLAEDTPTHNDGKCDCCCGNCVLSTSPCSKK